MEFATTGASLTLTTVNSKSSDTLSPDVSVAVTLRERAPTLSLVGVPLNVMVAVSNINHEGKSEPLAKVAL